MKSDQKYLIKGFVLKEELIEILHPMATLYLLNTNLLDTVLTRANTIHRIERISLRHPGSMNISSLFNWDMTPEGGKYWVKIYDNINELIAR